MSKPATGPLAGLRIVEFVGLGPAPFAAMQFADMGADVVRIARPDATPKIPDPISGRGRPTVEADLKNPDQVEMVRKLCDGADALKGSGQASWNGWGSVQISCWSAIHASSMVA